MLCPASVLAVWVRLWDSAGVRVKVLLLALSLQEKKELR